jgi:hypothetical protein
MNRALAAAAIFAFLFLGIQQAQDEVKENDHQ